VRDKQVRRRRVVLALLVAVSVGLLTVYFGESSTSPLHRLQQGIVTALTPVQEGASKVLKPFADIPQFFSDAFKAKSHVARLEKENQQLSQRLALLTAQINADQQLHALNVLNGSLGIESYHPVTADVIVKDPTLWYQTVQVDKGSADGVALEDPVLAPGGLAGKVTTVGSDFATVTLITDHTMGVTAALQDPTNDWGVLVPAVGDPTELLLTDVPTPQPGQPWPAIGDRVVTAGFKSGPLDSLYPPGILIGTVSNASQDNIVNNAELQVAPAVDLRHLQTVEILTTPYAGTQRASVP
jgi:rod shape-determining protein MreC